MSADLLKVIDLMKAMKDFLAAIPHPTLAGQKLFEVVSYHEDKNLAEALAELIIVKSRVCLIVPAGDRFVSVKEGRELHVNRFTSIDLVMGDKAYLKGGQDAAFGGEKNVGVVAMNDLVVAALAADPQLGGLRWCALCPMDGAMLTLAAEDAKKAPGRQAYVLNYETPSGEIILPLMTAWAASN